MSTDVTVLGLGEAGWAIASDLAVLGLAVSAHDPDALSAPAGVRLAQTCADAVDGAAVVLALVPGDASVDVAVAVAQHLRPEALYGDFATASPDTKRTAAASIEPCDGFLDVALMGTVPSSGLGVPALASGPRAVDLATRLHSWGMPIDVVSHHIGEASTRKLLRSVVLKGLAASLDEALAGARATATESWLIDEIGAELASADSSLVQRLITGTRQHATRRAHEMEAAAGLLADHDVDPTMSRSTMHRLRRLADATQPGT